MASLQARAAVSLPSVATMILLYISTPVAVERFGAAVHVTWSVCSRSPDIRKSRCHCHRALGAGTTEAFAALCSCQFRAVARGQTDSPGHSHRPAADRRVRAVARLHIDRGIASRAGCTRAALAKREHTAG